MAKPDAEGLALTRRTDTFHAILGLLAAWATLSLLLGIGLEISLQPQGHANDRHGWSYVMQYIFIPAGAAIGLIVLGGPVWIVFDRLRRRELRHALMAGGGLAVVSGVVVIPLLFGAPLSGGVTAAQAIRFALVFAWMLGSHLAAAAVLWRTAYRRRPGSDRVLGY